MQLPAGRNRRTTTLWAVVIFFCALAVRLIHIGQIAAMPFFKSPIGDGRAYWEWAGRIAAGDWRGQGVFYQAPLYPYFLAVNRALFHASPPTIYVIQSILNAGSCVLLFLTGRRLFSHAAGVVAGMMLAFYPPAILFDGVLQKEALAIFFMSALLFLAVRTLDRPAWWDWLGIGALLGLLALTRENLLLFLPVVLVWMALRMRGFVREKRLVWAGAVALGLAVTLLPVGFRNLFVGGEFALTTSQMGSNFFIGNNPSANGTYIPLRPTRGDPAFERKDATDLAEQGTGKRLSPGEVSAYWMGRSLRYIRSQPVAWARLMAKKAGLFWNASEVPDAEDPLFYRRWSLVLRVLEKIWHFGILFPLSAAGVALTWRRRRELWLLYALALAMAVGVSLFYIFARYRLPIVPILILFAGVAPVAGLEAARARQRRAILIATGLLAATAVLARLPLYPRPGKDAGSFYNWAYILSEEGMQDEAAEKYAEAARLDPNMAQAHFNLAKIRSQQGKTDDAVREYREAVRVAPAYSDAWNNMGIALVRSGHFSEGAEAFLKGLHAEPGNPNARQNVQRALGMARQAGDAALADRLQRALGGGPTR